MVLIIGFTGDEMFINCGIPQVSVLGQILFILYMNIILSLVIKGLIVTFAYDACLLFPGHSWNKVIIKATKTF